MTNNRTLETLLGSIRKPFVLSSPAAPADLNKLGDQSILQSYESIRQQVDADRLIGSTYRLLGDAAKERAATRLSNEAYPSIPSSSRSRGSGIYDCPPSVGFASVPKRQRPQFSILRRAGAACFVRGTMPSVSPRSRSDWQIVCSTGREFAGVG